MNVNQLINFIRFVSESMNQTEQKWFLCFGTLLKLIRDRVFDTSQDIDIGVIGSPSNVISVFNVAIGNPTGIIINDVTKESLNLHYQYNDVNIDIFFWKKIGAYYYHTYDTMHERKPVPSKYVFKGVPASCFEAEQELVQRYRRDQRIGYMMNIDGTFKKLIPGLESEGISVNVPWKYGALFDFWYPNWGERNDKWGVSESPFIKEVKSCKELK
jgi:hypothetical protein